MPWPQSQDYNEAIQNPQSSFGDPELRGGQAVTNAMGVPMPRSGNFADVYEFIGASGQKWAIKCFTRQVPGLQERYADISKHLAQAKLPCMVDFDYLARGIRVHGEFYPVLKMHWVEGLLLNEFVRSNSHKPSQMKSLSQVWLKMAIDLRCAGLAHADLQHGNVILVPGGEENSLAVKLIDYDWMWVPALAQKPSREVGHPNYQHPKRLKQGIYSAEVDRLPILAVACALGAVAAGGKALWDIHDNGDNLLFREVDLRAPAESALLKTLWYLPEASVHDLVGQLVLGLIGPLSRVPLLQDLGNEDSIRPLTPAEETQVAAILGPGAAVKRDAGASWRKDTQTEATLGRPASSMSDSASLPWEDLALDADFAHWRVWAAHIRDSHPEGATLRDKALSFCSLMDAWSTTSSFLARGKTARPVRTQILRPIEISVEKLLAELIQLGAPPPSGDRKTKLS